MDENTKHEKGIKKTLEWAEGKGKVTGPPHDHTSPKFEKQQHPVNPPPAEVVNPPEAVTFPMPGQYTPPTFANKVGRPTDYTPLYNEQAKKLAALGATDLDVADFFGVCEKTIYNWMKEHEEFLQAIKEGKALVDDMVEKALLQRALGYSHAEEKVFCSEGSIVTHQGVKQYPPDTQAASLWLRNRRPQEWRDKQEIEHHVPFTINMEERDVNTL